MNDDSHNWRTSASVETLKRRAQLIDCVRRWLTRSGAFEVETPAISRFATTEVHLSSWMASTQSSLRPYHLHTSPELFMKRVLASGSGDIFQLCKVFRADESGRKHNPEFTLLEWYKTGVDLQQMMDEVYRFTCDCFLCESVPQRVSYSYQQLFERFAGIDPFDSTTEQLAGWSREHINTEVLGMDTAGKDDWLDLIVSHHIEPQLDRDTLTFVYHYPASQASLARLNADNPQLAERFEVYYAGLELANGFHELTDANEQQQRMQNENKQRALLNLPELELDKHFLAALQHGLPDCCGVAVGIDRLVMATLGSQDISDVLSFDFERV